MNIVLRENEWAEEMVATRTLGSHPFDTLRRVARYYMDQGYTQNQVRKKMDEFVLRCDAYASLVKWSDVLDKSVKSASKHPAVDIDRISISKTELEKVNALDGRMMRRLAFTLLCLAKYWKIVRPNNDYWVEDEGNEIMKMANINTSIRRQGALYHSLKEEGLIEFSKKIDNTNILVLFVDDGETELEISDFRNLGYQYLMYCGEPYFECCECGIVTKYKDPKNKRRQKYCSSCAAKVIIQRRVNLTMSSVDGVEKNR